MGVLTQNTDYLPVYGICITQHYTTDTIKIVGSYIFYLVNPDTEKLQEVTFYVAQMMAVSCCPALQHLCLDLYNLAQD